MESLIILASWYLNAMADAIDHGKGARSLYELWHIVKFTSYTIPYAYLIYVCQTPILQIVWTVALAYGWELVYLYLRQRNFQEWDDKVDIPWLRWIWGIKRG